MLLRLHFTASTHVRPKPFNGRDLRLRYRLHAMLESRMYWRNRAGKWVENATASSIGLRCLTGELCSELNDRVNA